MDDPELEQKFIEARKEVIVWAQCVLTALAVGDVKSGSALHHKLRETMINYRAALAAKPAT